MNKKRLSFSLLAVILMIFNITCFAPNMVVAPPIPPAAATQNAYLEPIIVLIACCIGGVGGWVTSQPATSNKTIYEILKNKEQYCEVMIGKIEKMNSMPDNNKKEKMLHYMCQRDHKAIDDLLKYKSPSWIKDFPEKEVVFKETSSTDGLPAERE